MSKRTETKPSEGKTAERASLDRRRFFMLGGSAAAAARVRPALQGDGGDIALLRIEQNDVYVRLVGSCSSCPSSVMTMKMGVEALLREELPGFGNLIQVD